ncbi:hypothetical protein DY052_09120 [Apilactobacillus timberlakei]|uniref:hypothetical protein n=1 Tax=Apilactobacillus timberlakei TaxID=2008380 RepID=UPI00112D3A6F|nr:hypothetical protein [Apilactobacillus timberlakei]TPR12809.1 hypothetical protein DY052_09120 [Apilactobacillus timberlakei]
MKGYLGDILKIGIVLAVGFALFGIYKSGVPQMATDMLGRFSNQLKNMVSINPMDMVNIAKSTFFLK